MKKISMALFALTLLTAHNPVSAMDDSYFSETIEEMIVLNKKKSMDQLEQMAFKFRQVCGNSPGENVRNQHFATMYSAINMYKINLSNDILNSYQMRFGYDVYALGADRKRGYNWGSFPKELTTPEEYMTRFKAAAYPLVDKFIASWKKQGDETNGSLTERNKEGTNKNFLPKFINTIGEQIKEKLIIQFDEYYKYIINNVKIREQNINNMIDKAVNDNYPIKPEIRSSFMPGAYVPQPDTYVADQEETKDSKDTQKPRVQIYPAPAQGNKMEQIGQRLQTSGPDKDVQDEQKSARPPYPYSNLEDSEFLSPALRSWVSKVTGAIDYVTENPDGGNDFISYRARLHHFANDKNVEGFIVTAQEEAQNAKERDTVGKIRSILNYAKELSKKIDNSKL